MRNTCETIKIVAKNEQGFVIINLSDFDPKTMKEFKPKAAKTETINIVSENEQGFLTINKTDFDAETMTEWTAKDDSK